MPCLSVETKRRIASLHTCSKALLNIYLRKCVAWMLHVWLFHTLITIPLVAHDKLQELCMFYATRKHGTRKNIMGCIVNFCGTMRGIVKLQLSGTVINTWLQYSLLLLVNLHHAKYFYFTWLHSFLTASRLFLFDISHNILLRELFINHLTMWNS